MWENNKEMHFFTGGSVFMDVVLNRSDGLKFKCLKGEFVYNKHTDVTSPDVNWWIGVVWIIVMFLSAVWSLILTAPIHCSASIAESSSQVKSSKFYCQFFHMYSTYIQRIEIALLSDPWCIQLTLNTDSRHSNTDKYSLTICTYKLYRYTNEDIVEQ